jgi:hypothetical protein
MDMEPTRAQKDDFIRGLHEHFDAKLAEAKKANEQSRSRAAKLPGGIWMKFEQMPKDTTLEELQAFLLEIGIDLPLDRMRIALPDYGDRAIGMISLTKGHVANIVTWMIDGRKLRGREMVPFIPPSEWDK